MTVDRRPIAHDRAVGASSDVASTQTDPIAFYTSTSEAARVDRVCASDAARRSIAAGGAPRFLTIEGLERMRRTAELGDGRRLMLDWGLYRLVP